MKKLNKFSDSIHCCFYHSVSSIVCGNCKMYWMWFWLWVCHDRKYWKSDLWLLGSYEHWTRDRVFTRDFGKICEKENPCPNSSCLDVELLDFFCFRQTFRIVGSTLHWFSHFHDLPRNQILFWCGCFGLLDFLWF